MKTKMNFTGGQKIASHFAATYKIIAKIMKEDRCLGDKYMSIVSPINA